MKMLSIPISENAFAHIPFPMREEDYKLIIDTLELWKPRLVAPLYRIEADQPLASQTVSGMTDAELRLWTQAVVSTASTEESK